MELHRHAVRGRLQAWKRRLSAGSCLAGCAAVVVLSVALAPSAAAQTVGGNGGSAGGQPQSPGAGGTLANPAGGNAAPANGIAGGGGGGPSGTGGNGGTGGGGAGGLGGTGGGGIGPGGNGGAGGLNGFRDTFVPTTAQIGNNGANGGDAGGAGSGGGGGGAGGYGAVVDTSTSLVDTLGVDLTGGNGGNGGAGGSSNGVFPGWGGNGGGGGGGLYYLNANPASQLTINSGVTVRGGTGGNGGLGGVWSEGDSTRRGGNGGNGGVSTEIGSAAVTFNNSGTLSGGNGGIGGGGNTAGTGGAGGSGGAGVAATAIDVVIGNSGTITGGIGGTGGNGGDGGTIAGEINAGVGGVGGSGGAGIAVTAAGVMITNSSGSILGGAGGTGGKTGDALATGFGRDGGDGGAGGAGIAVANTATGVTISNFATIAGGAGGSGGLWGRGGFQDGGPGASGAGGAGIVGAGLTITNSGTGTISGGLGNGGRANAITFTGGTNAITFNHTGTTGLVGNIGVTGSLNFNQNVGVNTTVGNIITGAGSVSKGGADTITFSAANTYTGGTTVNAGTLALSGAGTLGAVTGATTVTGGTLDLGTTTQTQNGGVTLTGGTIQGGTLFSSSLFDMQAGSVSTVLAGAGVLTKSTSDTVTLSGINSYTGATTVNGGTLVVDGSIASSVLTSVNSGATLSGIGTVGATQVNSGGVFAPGSGAPGTAQTVSGTLAFASGGIYRVFVDPTQTSSANVTGAATLTGGTVDARFASGAYLARSYTILTAGTRNGVFSGLTTTNLPEPFVASLGYATANAVTLNLTVSSSVLSPLSPNQQAAGNTIVNFFNNGGALPPGFVTLIGLTGQAQQTAFAQVSGEGGNGAVQQTLLNAVDKFIATMLDPFIVGRGSEGGAGGGATGYAEAGDDALAYAGKRRATKAERDAYKAVTPRDARAPGYDMFVPRWSVWAAGYGGTASVDGNAAAGTHNTSSSIYGTAVGADYRAGRDTLVGFAMAGGGTHFSTEQGLGKGRADIFQIGGYGRHNFGPLYVAGALAYGWQDVSVERTVTVAGTDQLRSNFDAHTFAARAETGYRFAVARMGVTPYGALQVTSVRLPGYTEFAVSGSNQFALGFAAQTETNLRSELGVRNDKSFVTDAGLLTFRSRVAWAHDSNTDRVINPTFQSLPGAAFTVNGAKPAADGVLVSAGADMKWRNGWSVAGVFEGEFSSTTESYAGKGAVRYAW